MQQKLAVASILFLVVLTGASIVAIQSHGAVQGTSSNSQPSTSGGSLLVNGNPSQTGHSDDGVEVETGSAFGSDP